MGNQSFGSKRITIKMIFVFFLPILAAMLVPEEPLEVLDFPSSRSMEEPDNISSAMDTEEPNYASLEEEPDSQSMTMDTIPEVSEELMNATTRSIRDFLYSKSSEAYCKMGKEHTVCKYRGPKGNCLRNTWEIGATERKIIVDEHNKLRRKVAKGQEEGQPAASNMRRLVWNSELAAISQIWADQCKFEHDIFRDKVNGDKVGQNLARQGVSKKIGDVLKKDINLWYSEVTSFKASHIQPYVFAENIGHYSQLVWADAEEIGCGIVQYSYSIWLRSVLVCNYAVKGKDNRNPSNLPGGTMYKKGRAGSDCPDGYINDDGLCANCKEKFNEGFCGGTLEKWIESGSQQQCLNDCKNLGYGGYMFLHSGEWKGWCGCQDDVTECVMEDLESVIGCTN